jgi:hypothetical protein
LTIATKGARNACSHEIQATGSRKNYIAAYLVTLMITPAFAGAATNAITEAAVIDRFRKNERIFFKKIIIFAPIYQVSELTFPYGRGKPMS